ncbi:MAG: hypothetical protein H6Q90_2635 [Deltaproteobacteria bacterium]|nr:hypothetical protein [Deltaproteobacteria bacterium]
MHIAAIPLDQKQSVVQTQNDWSVAKMENAKAEADFNAVTSELTGVRNEREKAKLQVNTAISNKKSAEASSDTNKVNVAQKDLRSAELAVKAADARLKYYEAYRGYLKRVWRTAQENMYWREAQYELAKAQLAQKNNIAPKGITYDSFPKQEGERNKRANSAKSKSESEKNRATGARDEWVRAQQTADQAAGTTSSFPDPMMPAVQPTTTGTLSP